jgi:biotin operon repressor
MSARLKLDIERSVQNKHVQPVKNDNGVKISTQDEESYQLEDDNIQRLFIS